MSRVFFEGWYSGVYAKAEDWLEDDLVYVNVRQYTKSTCSSRPDIEKSFLLRTDEPERLSHYAHTIVYYLSLLDEKRDSNHHMIPLSVTLPQIDFMRR